MKNGIKNSLYYAFQMFMPNLGSFFTFPDPDPWPENIPDPHGSGSATLGTRQRTTIKMLPT